MLNVLNYLGSRSNVEYNVWNEFKIFDIIVF